MLKNECSQRQLYSELPIRSLFLESKVIQPKAERVATDARIPEQVISRVNGRQWSNGSWRWTVFPSGLVLKEGEFSLALVYLAHSTHYYFFSRFLLSLHNSNGESYGEEQLVFLKQRAAHVGVDTVGEMLV